jgi:hypothetical protein
VTTVRRTLVVVAAAALAALGPAAARPAYAADAGKPGYCTDDVGVTVVVDFSALGGDVVVRCATGPGGHGFTGLDALDGAGFSVAGTQRWGMQFVCRIQGRPSAREDLAIPGDDSYHESCADTPPETAYWSYWYASNGGAWKYTSVAAASHSTVEGGFEGWSFHLGSGSAHPPAVAPKHAVEAPTSSPPSKPGGDHAPDGTGGPTTAPAGPTTSSATTAPSGDPSSASGGKPTRRHHAASDGPGGPTKTPGPSTPTPTTMQADGPKITTALPEQPDDGSSGSAAPFLIGAGILTLLGAGAGATAWRRSHRG